MATDEYEYVCSVCGWSEKHTQMPSSEGEPCSPWKRYHIHKFLEHGIKLPDHPLTHEQRRKLIEAPIRIEVHGHSHGWGGAAIYGSTANSLYRHQYDDLYPDWDGYSSY